MGIRIIASECSAEVAVGKKLFLVRGKANNIFPGTFGDPLLIDISEFVAAVSPEEATNSVFSDMQAQVEDFPVDMDRWRNGQSDFPLPPLPPNVPTNKGEWRAEEVKIAGFEIVLRPVIKFTPDEQKENARSS